MMPRNENNSRHIEVWKIDQIAKSAFFHRKLHEWKLIEISDEIDQVHGENLDWDNLQISEQAWNKVIHRGIKPIIIFAHPDVLQIIVGSAGYYRMLAMVSQKSMKRIGINVDKFEKGKSTPDPVTALTIAQHLNSIISQLIEIDAEIDTREFDLWRGMAAGSQAQGSWQNAKGSSAEIAIEELLRRRLQEKGFSTPGESNRIQLGKDRVMVFADEPDIAIYLDDVPQVAVEIKGGIDPAGVLERLGAALKSLRRTRQENPASITVLILQDASLTQRVKADLSINSEIVTHLFSMRAILEEDRDREQFFQILGI